MMQTYDRTDIDEMFQAVRGQTTLVGRVAGQIERLILEGRLAPDDSLPAQSELAARFGVSRTVVREAVRVLATKGLLEVRSGSRITVRSPTAESVAESMGLFLKAGRPGVSYDKVHEIRRVLEVEIAGLAAERRTEQDLAELAAILQEAAQTRDDRDRFTKYDMAFHSALAAATHNELFSLLLDAMADTMFQVRLLGHGVPGTVAYAIEHHTALFEQVKRGDPEGARRAMQADLAKAEEIQRLALELQRDEE